MITQSTKPKLLKNARIVTLSEKLGYGIIENGMIVIANEKIIWTGNPSDLPKDFFSFPQKDFGGRLITPALIDCHTHIVFGGNRAKEFELRLLGASYEEIARAGGGIVSTVEATRNSSPEELKKSALLRLDHLIAEGVNTIEIKSGYGLDQETELKMLRCARELEQDRKITVYTSFLGAHAIPKEYKGKPDSYIEEICLPTLHKAHSEGLVDAVDGFCENIAFSVKQIRRLFEEAALLKIPVKLHAEQLSQLGGTQLATEFLAISVDHLEYANEQDVAAMAKSGSVAVLLPGAFYTLKEKQSPPIKQFKKYGVPMAIATDCNPGSSPLSSILVAMNLACTLFGLTPEEALRGVTINSAKALGLKNVGKIEIGQKADLAVWNLNDPAELSYRIGYNPLHQRIFRGNL